jgi:transcriptional regulator with XRE-family HTH domain
VREKAGVILIGERLYDLRKDKGLSQEELGEILNINKHSISSYERGRSEPPDDIKIILAKYFNVSVDYLLGLTDVPNAYDDGFYMIKLPKNFPKCEEEELKRFIAYLTYKHRNDPKGDL